MSTSKDIRDYLASQLPAEKVYKTKLPHNIKDCIAVFDTGGRDRISADTRAPSFQVWVRSADYEVGYGKANQIQSLLYSVVDQIIGENRYLSIDPIGEIMPHGEDPGGFYDFTVNFSCYSTAP